MFSVSFFFSADNNDEKTPNYNDLYIRKNGTNLDEGRIWTNVHSSTNDDDSSGKSLLLHLNKEEDVSVYMSRGLIHYVSFCVHSI